MPLIQLGAGSIAPNIAAWLATWSSFRTLALAAAGAAIAGYILLAAAVAIYARRPHLSPDPL
jgi:flagellar biosynthesis/type III secretory pathway M-ring protein FliF/YscJ